MSKIKNNSQSQKRILRDTLISLILIFPLLLFGVAHLWAASPKVATGNLHTVALKSDGTLWAWGYNLYGQLGNNSNSDSNTPVQVSGGGQEWVTIAGGSNHTVAIKSDGTLWAWGWNSNGQLGNNSNSDSNTPVQVSGGGNIWVSVAAGRSHTVALKSDGTLWAWGDNFYGQLGNNSNSDSNTPVQVSGNWTAISAGYYHTVALKSDGTLWAWGYNLYGQLGNNSNSNSNTPVQVSGTWTSIFAGQLHTVALKSDGTLWAWGHNLYGQLGNNSNSNSNTPVQVFGGGQEWVTIAGGSYHTGALKSDGTLWAWGSNINGRLGDGSNTDRNTPVQVFGGGRTWTAIATGQFHTVALKSNGTLWAWGNNLNGQLGDGTFTETWSPVQITTVETNWVSISAGTQYTSALKSDGTLWTWGKNPLGQLGDGSTTERHFPVQVFGGGTNWVSVSAGYDHSVAHKSDGSLWAWGHNDFGQFGDGTTTNSTTPVQESTHSTTWVSVSAGRVHTVAHKSDGTLWAWGNNYYGQLGDGTTTNRTTPVQESTHSTNWVCVSTGNSSDHTVALKSDGTLWAWGYNGRGQLGDGTTGGKHSPTQESTYSTNWVSISAGGAYTVALKSNGTLWTWGANDYGQLGDGSTIDKNFPVQESTHSTNWVSVSAGGGHTMALKSDGTLWAWGAGFFGELGDGSTTNKTTPVQEITHSYHWVSVSAGNSHTVALKSDGTLWTWGNNIYGALGDGTTNQKNSPIKINLHTVTANAGSGGIITPSGAVPVNDGYTQVFYVIPNGDYYTPSVTGCGGSLIGYTYTTGPITADCTVTAAFAVQLTISGDVTLDLDGLGLPEVTMSGLPGNPLTSEGGEVGEVGFYQAIVDYGWSGTVTPTLAGYSFSPSSASYINVTSPYTQSYIATLQTYTLTVTKSGTGNGIVTSSPAGINCGADCDEPYPYNTVVTLTAGADSNSVFEEWLGACSGTGSCQVTMESSKSVTAKFRAKDLLDNWYSRTSGTSNWLYGVTYGNGTFAAVGLFGTILTSSDGTIWTPRTSGTSELLHGATYGNGTFVAVGTQGVGRSIVTSSDGISWTPNSYLAVAHLRQVTYGNGTFVAVGEQGTILTSSDAISWEPQTSGTTNTLFGVTYGNGTFVAVGGSGTTLTSTNNGASWTPRTSGTVPWLYGVTYGNGTFVSVGDSGTILTSSDGTVWDPKTSGTTSTLFEATYGNGTFAAVGGSGTILTSTNNGASWTPRTSGTTYSLLEVTYGNGTFVAVGAIGTILQSDPIGNNLTIIKAGDGDGTVRSTPFGINCSTDCNQYYDSGTIVTLTAAPDSGSYFGSWSGPCLTSGLTCKVKMDAAKTVTATFTTTPPAVTTWAKTYGGSGYDAPHSIQQTSDGGYIVAGVAYSFDGHIWVLKLSADGSVAWQNTYGGPGTDVARSIQQTSDGGYVVAGYTLIAGWWDFWVLKLNTDGSVAWQNTYGGSGNDFASSIQQTSDGGYIVAGYTNSFGAGSNDIWVLKLNTDGSVAWQNTYGGSGNDFASSIQQTSDGGYIVAGYTNSFGAGSNDIWVLKLNTDGSIAWQKTYGGSDEEYIFTNSIQQTWDGGYIVAGYTNSFSPGSYKIWVLKLDTNGEVVWQNTYGGPSTDSATSIQQTSDGGYVVAGYTLIAGWWDFWVLKLSADGSVAWQNTYGGSGNDLASSIQQTSDGGFIVAGRTTSFGAGSDSDDIWVLKLDSEGNILGCPGGVIETSSASVETPTITITTPTPTVGNTSATIINTTFEPVTTTVTPGEVCTGIPPCTYLISPASELYPSGGGTGTVSVTAPAGCSWTSASNDSWIIRTSGSSGSGNGTVDYLVTINQDPAVRTGTMTIAGQTFTITQYYLNSDTDLDGLPDDWEITYFGNLNQGAGDDPDGDGLTNLREYQLGSNPNYKDDINNDGIGDGVGDIDGDGIIDANDNCPFVYNPGQEDFNNDGYGDACQDTDLDGILDASDLCPSDPDNDIDNDGICAGMGFRPPKTADNDNCPDHSNPDQLDTNGDGIGDACTGGGSGECRRNCAPVATDSDNDGKPDDQEPSWCVGLTDCDGDGRGDGADNCILIANADQTDTNQNGIGNACDTDADGDGIADKTCNTYNGSWCTEFVPIPPRSSTNPTGTGDNCPLVANGNQLDSDNDGVGNACDNCLTAQNLDQADQDQDGIGNACDNCPSDNNPDQLDSDHDALGDACDPVTSTYTVLFELKEFDTGADITATWLPKPPLPYPNSETAGSPPTAVQRSKVKVVAKLRDPNNNITYDFPNPVTFTLVASNWPGVATNDEETCSPACSNDFSFYESNNSLPYTASAGSQVFAPLFSFDYAGQARITATTVYNGATVEGTIILPLDSDNDLLPDILEEMIASIYPTLGISKNNRYSLDPTNRQKDDGYMDIDTSLENSINGDGLINFAEYRGIIFDRRNADGSIAWSHKRLDPKKKDLFVRGDGYSNSTECHPTLLTKPAYCTDSDVLVLPFVIGPLAGESSSWQNAFEEAGIVVHDVTGMPSFSGATEPPNIDILVATNNTTQTGTIRYPNLDGYINLAVGCVRCWTWDEKGADHLNATATRYSYDPTGNAKGGSFTYHLNLMHYVYNKPYRDITASDSSNVANSGHIGLLDPRTIVEDSINEDGVLQITTKTATNEDKDKDQKFKGDRIHPQWKNQKYGDLKSYRAGYQFSTFNADGDEYVELPIVSDPLGMLSPSQEDTASGEYSKLKLQRHTILHELGHGAGIVNPEHTSIDSCLMYTDSNNWNRAGHFSTGARSQIKIHNQ